MEAAVYQEAKAEGDESSSFQPQKWNFVLKMGTLPLREVEVFVSDFPRVISDCPFHDSDIVDPSKDLSVLWTAEDRMEYAERIRKTLLDLKGAETC